MSLGGKFQLTLPNPEANYCAKAHGKEVLCGKLKGSGAQTRGIPINPSNHNIFAWPIHLNLIEKWNFMMEDMRYVRKYPYCLVQICMKAWKDWSSRVHKHLVVDFNQ